jgi:CheY-like chemotaxis protein
MAHAEGGSNEEAPPRMECPGCRNPAPPDAEFCPACGAGLVVACPECRTTNATASRYCKRCGRPLGSDAAGLAGPDPGEAAAGRPLVLVADDEPALRELISEVLAEAGFRTVRATDGAEVLDLAIRHQPRLIILDIMMPKMDGYTTLTRLRGHPATQDVPVIVVTGQTGPLYQTLSFGTGATAHITKPFSPRQLMETVERLIRERPA